MQESPTRDLDRPADGYVRLRDGQRRLLCGPLQGCNAKLARRRCGKLIYCIYFHFCFMLSFLLGFFLVLVIYYVICILRNT